MPGIMKTTCLIAIVLASAAAHESCYKGVDDACSQPGSKSSISTLLEPCNATYGDIDIVMKDLVNLANSHLTRSFEYLLMSTHYGTYQKNRPGFQNLYRGLSDSKWEEAIDIIKHITTRGGKMEIRRPPSQADEGNEYELYEIQSLAKALEIEKFLALEAFDVHKAATARSENKHDPEISSFVEKEFVHEQAKTVRKLAGYVTDLKAILSGPDADLGLHLFDEYLEKQ